MGEVWYGKGVVWHCGVAAQVGDASGSIGRILEDQAQRGGRQAGGWLLFDAALVWLWFGFLSGFGFGTV